MRKIGCLALLLALGCLCGCATKGVIRGRLDLPISAQRNTSATDRGKSLAEAVVYVEPLPERARPHVGVPETLRILTERDAFVPRVLAVSVGSTVEFFNADRVYHNTFSVSPTQRFDLGQYGPGERRRVTFERPGVVNLFCDLHPSAAGFVRVLPNPVFAQADATGTFVLPILPQGTYTVKAWHPEYGERRCRVNLPRAGDVSVKLRF